MIAQSQTNFHLELREELIELAPIEHAIFNGMVATWAPGTWYEDTCQAKFESLQLIAQFPAVIDQVVVQQRHQKV